MTDLMAFARRGRNLLLTQTCSIKRSGGSASGYTTPATVHASLGCSYIYEMSDEERERAGLTSVTRPCRCFVKVPSSGVIQEQDKLVTNSVEYLVVKAKKWPHEDAGYYELILDYQR